MPNCEEDKCKAIETKGNKDYLLSLNRTQIKLLMHNDASRKRFMKALKIHGCRLMEFYKIVQK